MKNNPQQTIAQKLELIGYCKDKINGMLELGKGSVLLVNASKFNNTHKLDKLIANISSMGFTVSAESDLGNSIEPIVHLDFRTDIMGISIYLEQIKKLEDEIFDLHKDIKIVNIKDGSSVLIGNGKVA